MKNKIAKKILSSILALSMLVSLMTVIPASAADITPDEDAPASVAGHNADDYNAVYAFTVSDEQIYENMFDIDTQLTEGVKYKLSVGIEVVSGQTSDGKNGIYYFLRNSDGATLTNYGGAQRQGKVTKSTDKDYQSYAISSENLNYETQKLRIQVNNRGFSNDAKTAFGYKLEPYAYKVTAAEGYSVLSGLDNDGYGSEIVFRDDNSGTIYKRTVTSPTTINSTDSSEVTEKKMSVVLTDGTITYCDTITEAFTAINGASDKIGTINLFSDITDRDNRFFIGGNNNIVGLTINGNGCTLSGGGNTLLFELAANGANNTLTLKDLTVNASTGKNGNNSGIISLKGSKSGAVTLINSHLNQQFHPETVGAICIANTNIASIKMDDKSTVSGVSFTISDAIPIDNYIPSFMAEAVNDTDSLSASQISVISSKTGNNNFTSITDTHTLYKNWDGSIKIAKPIAISIDYENETLTGFEANGTYIIKTELSTAEGIEKADETTTYALSGGENETSYSWLGETLYIQKTSGDSNSSIQMIEIPARPAAPSEGEDNDYIIVQPATDEATGGITVNNNILLQYSTDGDEWGNIPESIPQGTAFYLRKAASESAFVSEKSSELTIKTIRKVVFKNGGDIVDTKYVYDNAAVEITTETVEKSGYTLSGWRISGANENYSFDTPVTQNIELEAQWEAVKYNITVPEEANTLTINGESVDSDYKAAAGQSITFKVTIPQNKKADGEVSVRGVSNLGYDSNTGIYSFNMPDSDTAIVVPTRSLGANAVNFEQPESGTLTVTVDSAVTSGDNVTEDKTVTVSVTDIGEQYELKSITVNGETVTNGGTFVMPNATVTITAAVEKKAVDSVELSVNPSTVKKGQGVDVAVTAKIMSAADENGTKVDLTNIYDLDSIEYSIDDASTQAGTSLSKQADNSAVISVNASQTENITVTAVYEGKQGTAEITMTDKEPRAITIDANIANGTVRPSKTSSTEGETITIIIIPDAGYQLKENSVKVTKTGDTEEVNVTDNSFSMPDYDVTITAEFEKTDISITNSKPENDKETNGGYLSVAETAQVGDSVTITINTENGYRLVTDSVKINNSSEGITKVNDTTYKFIMPASEVIITAEFEMETEKPVYLDLLGSFADKIQIKKTDNQNEVNLTVSAKDETDIPSISVYIATYEDNVLKTVKKHDFVSNTVILPASEAIGNYKIFVWTNKYEPVTESITALTEGNNKFFE